MAQIELSKKSREHIIYRAKQRFKCSDKDSNDYIDNFIKVLKEQSPDDWRFTKSPVAKFLFYDQKSGFRILGRTYRRVGHDFLENLKMIKMNNNTPQKDHQKVTQKLAERYLKIIQNPNAEIIHELKTIYDQKMDIGELKHFYKSARIDLSHLIPINAKRIATRPNAIVTEKNELWVRQKELIKIPQEIDYLFFERLTKEGIDKSSVHIYTHDTQGNITLYDKYQVYKEEIIVTKKVSLKGFRTASYWSLPAYIDAIYLDLKYKSEKSPISLTEEELLLKFRIELIINFLKMEMGWSDNK